jgi:hypothetical protein
VSLRRAITALTAGLALAALAVVAGAADAPAASGRSLDGHRAAATPSVHRLDGHRAAATPSVHPLDGHRAAATPSVHRMDGHPSAATPSVRLTVDFTRRGGAGHHVAHVRCTAAGNRVDGFLRAVGAARACAHARRIAGLLASGRNPHRACSQIYGGPERALITGAIGGRRIRHGFSRTNGCGIADWRRAMPLLPRPG